MALRRKRNDMSAWSLRIVTDQPLGDAAGLAGGLTFDMDKEHGVHKRMGRDGSYGGWHSAHTGIGTLPVVYFGTEQQKRKYLPKLAKLEMLAAYALTEPLAGSDALAARTRADLAPDGKHYLLNGQKMWIAGVFDSPWRQSILSGFQLARIFSYHSGHPFNLLAGGEVNGDNHTTNERPIGAPRDTGLGPDYIDFDMCLTWAHKLSE